MMRNCFTMSLHHTLWVWFHLVPVIAGCCCRCHPPHGSIMKRGTEATCRRSRAFKEQGLALFHSGKYPMDKHCNELLGYYLFCKSRRVAFPLCFKKSGPADETSASFCSLSSPYEEQCLALFHSGRSPKDEHRKERLNSYLFCESRPVVFLLD